MPQSMSYVPLSPHQRAILLCTRCHTRPPRWQDQYCAPCAHAIARLQRWRQRRAIVGAWFAASVFEGFLALPLGAMALLALGLPAGPSLSQTGIRIMLGLVATVALLIGLAHAIIMHTTIRHWRWWGCISASEVLCYWSILTVYVAWFGSFPGITALFSLLVGFGTAIVQGWVLRHQTTHTFIWVFGSLCAWCLAASVALVIELWLPTRTLGVLWGMAMGRAVYGIGTAVVLAWVLTGTRAEPVHSL